MIRQQMRLFGRSRVKPAKYTCRACGQENVAHDKLGVPFPKHRSGKRHREALEALLGAQGDARQDDGSEVRS